MNPVVFISVILACIGLLDRIFGGKMQLADSMEQGLGQCGELMIDICGIYVVIQSFSSVIAEYGRKINFGLMDFSTLAGCLLASDMGGLPLCQSLAEEESYGIFAGTIIGGTMGGLICFYIPIYLQTADDKDRELMIKGFVYGMLVLPLPLILSGIIWGIPILKLAVNILPVILLCLLLSILLKKRPDSIIRLFKAFGMLMRFIIDGAFIWCIIALFFEPSFGLDKELIGDTVVMIVKMSINVAGALTAMNLLHRYGRKRLIKLGKILNVNEWSVLGFLVGMPTGIAMLPIYPKMDRRGKILNAAFCVSGHYMLGGQMALVAGTVSTRYFVIYMVNKSIGAVLAILLALWLEREQEGANIGKYINTNRKYT